jgi:NAD(P)-dependent dehydrogenase (short-subunit alcohol dehydrogenase family)
VLLYPTLRAEHPPVRILGYPLDAVVCCAGVLATVPEYTRECLERTLVVNYLSRYLLVRGTDHLLRGSPSGRVVLVANAGKYRDTLDLDDLQHRRHRPRLRVAGRTQFANDLFAVELAERWRDAGIQVACVYPGVVRTDVFGNARGVGATVRTLGRTVSRLVGSTPERAAFTPVFLAASPDARGLGGRFNGPGMREIRVPRRVTRPERRRGLWSASEAFVRQHLPAAVDHRDRAPWGGVGSGPVWLCCG